MRSFRLIPLAAVGLQLPPSAPGQRLGPPSQSRQSCQSPRAASSMWFPAWFSSSSPPSLGRRSSWKTAPVPGKRRVPVLSPRLTPMAILSL